VVRHGARREDATVLDVSLSGLSLQTALPLAQGDQVDVEIADGRVRVRALAWNARRVRRGQETLNVVGMMLSEVGPDYEALVMRTAGSRSPGTGKAGAAATVGAPAGRRAPPTLAVPGRLPWWRLRVKQKSGPRMQMVTLAAASAEDAAAQSLAEMGEGWEVVEVRPAASTGR
jgi:hypothetical protein